MSPKLFLVVNLWVRNFFLGYFVGLKVFHVDISWVGMCFLWVFRGFESFLVGASYICIFFSRKYFVGPRIFSWVFCRSPIFSPWFFVGPNLFSWIFGWHRLSLIREHLGGEWVDVDTSRKNVAFFN